MESQNHYHYDRIRWGDKVKYAILGAALGFGILYYTGTSPDETIARLEAHYQGLRPRFEEMLKR